MPSDAKFFIPEPVPTGKPAADSTGFAIYEVDGQQLKWSGKMPLPKIGDRIEIIMNRIGPGVVKGYFSEAGFLGVMTSADNPPEWLRKQRKEYAKDSTKPEWYRNGIGCEFGNEIGPRQKPHAKAKSVITKTATGFNIERKPCVICGEPPLGDEYACGHTQK